MGARAVVVASGDPLLAEAAGAYLDSRPGWRTAAVVPDGLAAVSAVWRTAPDAVLVTDDLPRLGATALAAEVRRRWPRVNVVVVGGRAVAGAVTVPPGAEPEAVVAALAQPAPQPAAAATDRLTSVVLLARLTRRERRVLRLVAGGRSVGQVAAELGLSHHTVRTHLQHVYSKLGCHTRVELVGFAARLGLLGRS